MPVLLAGALAANRAGPSAGVAVDPAVPARVVSVVTGAGLPTAAQLRKGLLGLADLPAGYTLFDEDSASTTEVPGSGWCREGTFDRGVPRARAHRVFQHSGGSMIDIEIVATGSRAARDIVRATAAVPTRCPLVEGNYTTKKFSRLPLPELGAPAAGLDEMFQDYVGEWSRYYHVVVASGQVTAIFTEMRGSEQSRDRFLKLVTTGVGRLARIR
ncbi:hypothetical protein FHX34_105744 [Actinoplanes teichomyceticus]|uniref:PknH-like protein n=1 Tax=Actinoplanes teichomyceticus TaxID=1867 RepID=A0A561VMM8_ACTTI|nr:hypothetical protein FHX34_105744 [Actinoplanes teichomyceticus]GIF13625.1 hypothetical protein Ate01nite_36570 [Actinoplanes teichomyceticus]